MECGEKKTTQEFAGNIEIYCGDGERVLTYQDLVYMACDLPPIAFVYNFPAAHLERMAFGLEKCGADIFVFNLSKKVKVHSYIEGKLKNRIIPKLNGKDFLSKARVSQTLFLKKHPRLNKDYEYYFCGENLHVSLHQESVFQQCELALVGDSEMLINSDEIAITLEGKKTIAWCSSAHPLTGFCGCTAGCAKWQQSGCADCPMLGRAVDGRDLCAELFARKRAALADIHDLVLAMPSRWLCRETQRSILGRRFFQKVIPSSVQLDVFCPLPQEEARKLLGIPDDRPVILTGSAGLRKNKGGHVLCAALRQLRGEWGSTPPRLLVFGYDAPWIELARESGVEVQLLGWIDDIHVMARIYAAADVFVSPSFQDNLPNTVNEALACGTPVICFDHFSSEDVVIDGVTGFLAEHPGLPLSPDGRLVQSAPYEPEPGRCTDLARKLHRFLELPAWRQQIMRWECRQLAEATFDPVLEAARYLQLFRYMLGLPSIAMP